MSTTTRALPLPAKVGVIGAGPAGLAAARVLSRETNVELTVLEKEGMVGGIWNYCPERKSASSFSAHNPSQADRGIALNEFLDDVSCKAPTPMYRGLKTNLPKEIMAFREMPIENIDHSFLTHFEVAEYLRAYQSKYRLQDAISLHSCVRQLTVEPGTISNLSPPTEQWPKISLEWETNGTAKKDTFDAVLVANGHFAVPSIPHIVGLETFKGRVVHSILYDDPKDWSGQTVLCVGGRASGADIAREISTFSDHVYLSDTTATEVQHGNKVTTVPRTIGVLPDGRLQFDCHCDVEPIVDAIIFCTGYDYHCPFITDSSNVILNAVTGERRVAPLYEHLWHARVPSLNFVGIPHSVLPFPLFEFQVEAICAQWKNPFLPKLDELVALAKEEATSGGPKGSGRVQDTHNLGSAQWDYCRRLAKLAGNYDNQIAEYILGNQQIYEHSSHARLTTPSESGDLYRAINYKRTGGNWELATNLNGSSQGHVETARENDVAGITQGQ